MCLSVKFTWPFETHPIATSLPSIPPFGLKPNPTQPFVLQCSSTITSESVPSHTDSLQWVGNPELAQLASRDIQKDRLFEIEVQLGSLGLCLEEQIHQCSRFDLLRQKQWSSARRVVLAERVQRNPVEVRIVNH
ncbi:hypothetical protein BpHYR1_027216 [Brachionus plicatilis]|uniref:Uncharacterized protein n=1 Tax=Brachionus plicatilis TaxID=10195 RepID=A0A3M7T7X8_BRAPC|nr:hypothetical protein BpHYR1_027216 [Brachionus plicatilis]